jgi:hypothetical protein
MMSSFDVTEVFWAAGPGDIPTSNIDKDFMLSHGYVKNDFDADNWAAPQILEQAVTEVLKEEWEKRSWSKLPEGGGSRWKARGSDSRVKAERTPVSANE